jgi:hypothetical protein
MRVISFHLLLLKAWVINSQYSIVNPTLGIHPVTAGRCAEKGKKLIDNYEGVWDILEKLS